MAQFNHYYQQLMSTNDRVRDWVRAIPLSKWAQAYDGGLRYGHMNTNLSESTNSMLKRARHLPVRALVKATYLRLGRLFATQGKEAYKQIGNNNVYVPEVQIVIEEALRSVGSIQIH
jgi:hypothetical protein